MFEFRLAGLDVDQGIPVHSGTTFDFLELCCQITQTFNAEVCGKFVEYLMQDKATELCFLRVIDWNFECRILPSSEGRQIIIQVERVIE